MSDRIHQAFAQAKSEHRAALVTFVMSHDPSEVETLAILDALVGAGVDVIELGMPFSDPMADGAVIQAAGIRALKAGASLRAILKLVRAFRAKHPAKALVLMGYYNPIYRYGAESFARDAAEAGVDGVIIVDLPPEEEEEFRPYTAAHKLHLIRLLTPTSDETRLPLLVKNVSGFIYYVAVTGVTGGKSADIGDLGTAIAQIKRFTDLPIAVGFGVKTAEQAKGIAAIADGVVVGSALVDAVAHAKMPASAAGEFALTLSRALK